MQIASNFTEIPKGVLVMVDAKPNGSVRKAVEEKKAAGKCLLCQDDAEKRGLCEAHYQRYRIAKNEQPVSQRLLFEAKQIRLGKILQSRQGQRLDIVNEYRS